VVTAARWLGARLRPHVRWIAAGVAAATAAQLAGVALVAVSVALLSAASRRPPILELLVAIVAVRALALVRAGGGYAERLAGHQAAFRLLASTRVAVYRRLRRLGPAEVTRLRAAELLHRMVDDVDALQQVVVGATVPLLSAVVTCVIVAGVTAALAPAALPPFALGVLVVVAATAVAATDRPGPRHDPQECGAAGVRVVEALEAADELVAAGAERTALAAVDAAGAAEQQRAVGRALRHGSIDAVVLAAAGGAVALAVIRAAGVAAAGALDPLLVGTVAMLVLCGVEAAAAVPHAVRVAVEVRPALQRLRALDAATPRAAPSSGADTGGAPERPTTDAPGFASAPTGVATRPHGGRRAPLLTARDLTVRHAGAPHPALRDVDLELHAGRVVAVVGRSGSGKSTLAAALAGMAPHTAGRILVDGRPPTGPLATTVGVAAQDAHVFAATVAANVRVGGPTAPDADVRDALRRAHLLNWIDALPHGLHTRLGEDGVGLSSGQRRRLALARTLLADRAIVVLDEPTADLDPGTAAAVLDRLLGDLGDRAVLLLTHEPYGLDRADDVIVLDGGAVIDRGSHADLLARPGLYRRMWVSDGAAVATVG
jgi:thiol reductant ABC exporter CydC subunit